MHKVKCVRCGQTFDRDKIPFIQVSERRYAHEQCPEGNNDEIQQILIPPQKEKEIKKVISNPEKEKKLKEEEARKKILEYCDKIFGEEANYPAIQRTLKKFVKNYNFTYSGIYKTLVYWYEIKGANPIKAHGNINIVEYIYKDAKEYYKAKKENDLQNQELLKQETASQKVRIVKIKSPKREEFHKNKFFSFLDEKE